MALLTECDPPFFFSRFLCFWVWMADGEKLFEKLNFSLKEDEEANPCQMECVFFYFLFFYFYR